MPHRRVTGKTSPVFLDKDAEDHHKALQGRHAAEAKEFWEEVAAALGKHKDKAAKLAETVRNTEDTKKVAGRTVPNSTRYVQTVTKASKAPIKKPI